MSFSMFSDIFSKEDTPLGRAFEMSVLGGEATDLCCAARMCFLVLVADKVTDISGVDFTSLARRAGVTERQAHKYARAIEARGLLSKVA